MEPLTSVDEAHIRELLDEGTYVWVDLAKPDREAIAALGRALPIHPLALEDSTEQGQWPKVVRYQDSTLIVFYGAQRGPAGVASSLEVHLHVGQGFLVTMYDARPEAIEELRSVASGELGASGGGVVYGLLDAITDSLAPVIELQHEELERLRPEILERPDRDVLGRVDELHGHVDRLHRRIAHQRDVFGDVAEIVLALPETPEDAKIYLGELRDHLDGAVHTLAEQVTAVDRLMDLYFNASSQHAGAVSRRLSFLAALLVPLTLVTGFFGMNFKWMTDELDSAADFFSYGVGGTLVALVVTLVILGVTSRS